MVAVQKESLVLRASISISKHLLIEQNFQKHQRMPHARWPCMGKENEALPVPKYKWSSLSTTNRIVYVLPLFNPHPPPWIYRVKKALKKSFIFVPWTWQKQIHEPGTMASNRPNMALWLAKHQTWRCHKMYQVVSLMYPRLVHNWLYPRRRMLY